MKTIAIIGGMGPLASIHAEKRLYAKLAHAGKKALVVHLSLPLEPFYASEPILKLTEEMKGQLRNLKADTGFIACNTMHYFFNDYQKLVNFPIVNLLEIVDVPKGSLFLCSLTAKKLNLFGDQRYASDDFCHDITTAIDKTYAGIPVAHNELGKLVDKYAKDEKLVFSCSETSMFAHEEGLSGYDTMEAVIDVIINKL